MNHQLRHILKLGFYLMLLILASAPVNSEDNAMVIQDKKHFSKVFGEERYYRVFLPTSYKADLDRRYPVIYFFHGYGGRYNGPAEGEPSRSAESRYYDEFNGNVERCGPDPFDNIADYVKTHEVILVKWDGYVKTQYPRPYDIGSVKDDLHFVDYFPELVAHIDSTCRTIATREGRATSGLSMGGFMSMFVASKYPHLISSASFFNPSAGFVIGPKALQVYTPFKEMGRNYIGLPIRQHIGMKDFLRQHNLEIDHAFKGLELFYESWQYGVNYFNGFHTVVNVEGQFDFHLKHFRQPPSKPLMWYHIDVYPNFELWGYRFESNRDVSGFTIIDEACEAGLKITTRQWLPDGPNIPDSVIHVTTDARYLANTSYQITRLNLADLRVQTENVTSDENGKIHFSVNSSGSDIGIHRPDASGFVSVADYRLDTDFPRAWQEIRLTPILFNKGGVAVDSIHVELMSQDEAIEVLDNTATIERIEPGEVHQQTSFRIRCRSTHLDRGRLKVMLKYANREDRFLLEVPFYSADMDLTEFEIGDGRTFNQDNGEQLTFGSGNGDGVADPGEWIAILTRSDRLDDEAWYGLKLYTNDSYVDSQKERAVWSLRPDWSGTARQAPGVYIRPDCPVGHEITFFGVYDFQKRGNLQRDRQGAHSFIHETKRAHVRIVVGQQH